MFVPQLDPVAVGRVIARFRAEKKMSQEVLSGLADLARGHLAMIERGGRKPTLETLYRISRALGVPMWVIVQAIEEALEQPEK